ncbi:MAG TPA: 50S ribosomal protein L11 [Nitrososphaerales archaeon]|nr:50S ribosomal protein L11 [Nitrososphaerales archaeon]
MPETKSVSALVVGGEANAGPPLGPALGPLGVNVMAIVKQINDLTKDYAGMRVPVKIDVDTGTKQFKVEVGIPTTSALIVKESGVAKGSATPKTAPAGNITADQLVKIAGVKITQSYGSTIKAVASEVAGSCVSMGITIEGKQAKEFLTEIKQNKWDEVLASD